MEVLTKSIIIFKTMCAFIFKRKNFPIRTIDQIKSRCSILFIDDQKFEIVEQLREKDGWSRTSRIKDLDSITQSELKDAHIVCIDIQGIGKKMGMTSGLELIIAIKDKYPEKKVIMYSAENQGKIDAFDEACNIVDFRLRKTATRYEFNRIIEKCALEAFTVENCIKRLKEVLRNDFSQELSESDIEKKLLKLSNKTIDAQNISSVFKITGNVLSILNIIKFFFSL